MARLAGAGGVVMGHLGAASGEHGAVRRCATVYPADCHTGGTIVSYPQRIKAVWMDHDAIASSSAAPDGRACAQGRRASGAVGRAGGRALRAGALAGGRGAGVPDPAGDRGPARRRGGGRGGGGDTTGWVAQDWSWEGGAAGLARAEAAVAARARAGIELRHVIRAETHLVDEGERLLALVRRHRGGARAVPGQPARDGGTGPCRAPALRRAGGGGGADGGGDAGRDGGGEGAGAGGAAASVPDWRRRSTRWASSTAAWAIPMPRRGSGSP